MEDIQGRETDSEMVKSPRPATPLEFRSPSPQTNDPIDGWNQEIIRSDKEDSPESPLGLVMDGIRDEGRRDEDNPHSDQEDRPYSDEEDYLLLEGYCRYLAEEETPTPPLPKDSDSKTEIEVIDDEDNPHIMLENMKQNLEFGLFRWSRRQPSHLSSLLPSFETFIILGESNSPPPTTKTFASPSGSSS